MPDPTILKWYVEMGGQCLTLGSDATVSRKSACTLTEPSRPSRQLGSPTSPISTAGSPALSLVGTEFQPQTSEFFENSQVCLWLRCLICANCIL
jgi:hypothetical protein